MIDLVRRIAGKEKCLVPRTLGPSDESQPGPPRRGAPMCEWRDVAHCRASGASRYPPYAARCCKHHGAHGLRRDASVDLSLRWTRQLSLYARDGDLHITFARLDLSTALLMLVMCETGTTV